MAQPPASATLNTASTFYTNLALAAMVGSDGTVLKDYRQNVTATLTNCSVVTGSGSEKGVQIDASGDYATFSNAAAYDPEGDIDWTMFVYMDLATGNGDGSFRSFMSRADDRDFSTDRWMFQCNFAQQMVINQNGTTYTNAQSMSTAAANNSSYAVTRSGDTLTWYENGVALGSTDTFTGGFGTGNTSALRIGDTSVPVLGTYKMGALWKGTALSDANIAALHADPWQLWRFDEAYSESVTLGSVFATESGPAMQWNTRNRRRAVLRRIWDTATGNSRLWEAPTVADVYAANSGVYTSEYTQNVIPTDAVSGALSRAGARSEAVTVADAYVSALGSPLERAVNESITLGATFSDITSGVTNGVIAEPVTVAMTFESEVALGAWTLLDDTPAVWTNL